MGYNLEFVVINCNNEEVKQEYFTPTDFLTDIESDKDDLPMLDDEVKNVVLYGKVVDNVKTVDDLYNYLLDIE
jgi:hypothetical protein